MFVTRIRRFGTRVRGRSASEWKRCAALSVQMLSDPLAAPPGACWSPVVGEADVSMALRQQPEVTGITIDVDGQLRFLKDLARYWGGLPDHPTPKWRYRSSEYFQPSDATVYYGILQHLRPKQLVEVGSGFTSALALDTKERHLPDLHLTFIEPYPNRLYSLLSEGDRSNCKIISQPVQDVPLEIFDQLDEGDLLFLDTAHVAKTGSEVNWLFFNVLPRLRSGVVVHLHDIFWPFEYPEDWLHEHLSYSELYLLRALLMFNSTFKIILFSNWAWKEHRALFTAIDATYAGGEPGSLWLVRQ
jgi:Methyltransferase domain